MANGELGKLERRQFFSSVRDLFPLALDEAASFLSQDAADEEEFD